MNEGLHAVMSALYASEINCGVSSFWDGGWTVWIGDDNNGRRAEATFDGHRLCEAPAWLINAAVEAYPGSAFAQMISAARQLAA